MNRGRHRGLGRGRGLRLRAWHVGLVLTVPWLAYSLSWNATNVPYWRLVTPIPFQDMKVGYCLNSADMWAEGNHGMYRGHPVGQEMPKVACTSPHDTEVFAVLDVDGTDFPGRAALINTASERCAAAFARYVGIPVTESTLTVGSLRPVQWSWSEPTHPNRRIVCYVTASTRTTGTLVQSRR